MSLELSHKSEMKYIISALSWREINGSHRLMFVLESNGWTKHRARFLGLKLGGAIPGYQFALYHRKEADSNE